MNSKINILILILSFFCQSFTLIDGRSISLEQIKNSGNGKILIIFSSGLSCHSCYGWLATKLSAMQQKILFKIYVITDSKDNVFQRKMNSVEVKKMLIIDLNETYIYDDPSNEFLKKYNAFTSPSILYLNGSKEQYISYRMLFKKEGLNNKVLDSLIK
jgi:hypothetical protein